MRIFYINKIGHSHHECEDAVLIDAKSKCAFVFDGVSNSKYGGEGAHYLAQKYMEAFHHDSARRYVTNHTPEEVRRFVFNICEESIKTACDEFNCRPIDLATTALIIVVYNDIVTVIHAGDGTIFGFSENEQSSPMILSYPDNAGDRSVYYAEHPGQLTRMRVIRFRKSDLKGIILGTDGFTDKYIRPYQSGFDGYGISADFESINSNADLADIIENKHLSRPAISDDISAVVIKFDNNVVYNRRADIAVKENDLTNNHENKDTKTTENYKAADVSNHTKADNNRRPGMGVIIFILLLSFLINIFATVYIVKRQMRKADDMSAEISSLENEISMLDDRMNTTAESTTAEPETEITTQMESVSDFEDPAEGSAVQSDDYEPSEDTQEGESETDEFQSEESESSEDKQKTLRAYSEGTGEN